MEPASKVKTLSIILWAIAALLVLIGIGFAIASFGIDEVIAEAGLSADEAAALSAAAAVISIITAVFCIIFAVLYSFIGKGLWDRRNWARVTALVLSWIGIVGLALNVIFSIFGGVRVFIFSLLWFVVFGAFEALFIWWLQFDKGVVGLFAEPVQVAQVATPVVKPATLMPVKVKPKKAPAKKKKQ